MIIPRQSLELAARHSGGCDTGGLGWIGWLGGVGCDWGSGHDGRWRGSMRVKASGGSRVMVDYLAATRETHVIFQLLG